MRQSTPSLISDCAPGDVVRIALGTVRITGRIGRDMLVRLVERQDALWREISEPWPVRGGEPVNALLAKHNEIYGAGQNATAEVDPLLRGSHWKAMVP
jgi:hypothetical protein